MERGQAHVWREFCLTGWCFFPSHLCHKMMLANFNLFMHPLIQYREFTLGHYWLYGQLVCIDKTLPRVPLSPWVKMCSSDSCRIFCWQDLAFLDASQLADIFLDWRTICWSGAQKRLEDFGTGSRLGLYAQGQQHTTSKIQLPHCLVGLSKQGVSPLTTFRLSQTPWSTILGILANAGPHLQLPLVLPGASVHTLGATGMRDGRTHWLSKGKSSAT